MSSSGQHGPSAAVVHKGSGELATRDTVKLSIADAHALGERALRRIGFTPEEAKIINDQLVVNLLSGYPFAGMSRIMAIATDPKTKELRTPIRVIRETPSSALVDGGNHVGYVSVWRAMEIAREKALASGFAVVGVANSYYSGRNAYFLEHLARADLVGIHVASAKPRVLPMGGSRPALGTNPIAIALPSQGDPLIFDMGTASIMWGDVMMKARLGEELPEGIGFDKDGHPTRDAAAAVEGGVVPFGGHKGYGLSVAIQALGLLAGAHLPRGQTQDYGFLFVAFKPDLLIPAAEYKAQVSQLVRDIKATPRQPGVTEITIPSERSFRERAQRIKDGFVVIDRKLHDELTAL